MVAFLTKETGWSIRYIMNLSLGQVKFLFAGYRDIEEIQSQNIDKAGSGSESGSGSKRTNVDKDGKQDDVEILKSIMMAKGFKVSDKARKKFQKILEKKQKDMKDA